MSRARAGDHRIAAILGPTNTGKTHLALERMMAHGTGVFGLPLRLLARELYDKVVKAKGPASVALITGEEKIVPPTARYFSTGEVASTRPGANFGSRSFDASTTTAVRSRRCTGT